MMLSAIRLSGNGGGSGGGGVVGMVARFQFSGIYLTLSVKNGQFFGIVSKRCFWAVSNFGRTSNLRGCLCNFRPLDPGQVYDFL